MSIFYGGQLCVPHSTCWYTRYHLLTLSVGNCLCAPSLVWSGSTTHLLQRYMSGGQPCVSHLLHISCCCSISKLCATCNYEYCSLNNRMRHISRICSTHAGILRSNTTLWPLDIFCIAHHLALGLYVIRCNTVGLSSLLHEVIGHYYGTSLPRVSNKGNNRQEEQDSKVSVIHSFITFF